VLGLEIIYPAGGMMKVFKILKDRERILTSLSVSLRTPQILEDLEETKEAFVELNDFYYKTCSTCNFLVLYSSTSPFCTTHNYWLTNKSSEVLSCKHWGAKVYTGEK
jgi:hypothetical protein